jgi:hypothetical protein
MCSRTDDPTQHDAPATACCDWSVINEGRVASAKTSARTCPEHLTERERAKADDRAFLEEWRAWRDAWIPGGE